MVEFLGSNGLEVGLRGKQEQGSHGNLASCRATEAGVGPSLRW